MSAPIGQFALILALGLAIIMVVVPFIGVRLNNKALMATAISGSNMVFLLVALSYAALTYAYIVSDFSILNVAENSHTLKPLLYKITGVWGNHEGSMLLWVLVLTFFTTLVALFGGNLEQRFRIWVLISQNFIAALFLSFVLFTSNPFIRLWPIPVQGNDLNPLLQDIGLAIHPPLLYLGYVGFSVCFSFAIAALIEKRLDALWARWVRPWTLFAWGLLTAGIVVGSYWAYYELGWGGYWYWDPVENASFMPWLVATALLHSVIVLEKRSALKIWSVLLAILAFSFSLLGTFLVRSGILVSAHSFAVDPERGLFILALLALTIGGALYLFALRAPLMRSGGLFRPISREGMLVFNNLILMTATATVLIGTLYPLLLETLTGQKISVGPPFFNLTFGVLIVPLLLIVPFGPLIAWKKGDLLAVCERLLPIMLLAVAVFIWLTYRHGSSKLAIAAGAGLGVWIIVGSLSDIWFKTGLRKTPLRTRLHRFIGLPKPVFGAAFAHAGLGVTLLGIVMTTGFSEEQVAIMQPGDQMQLGGYEIEFLGAHGVTGGNYVEDRTEFRVQSPSDHNYSVTASRRYFNARQMAMTEVGLLTLFPSQIYIAPEDVRQDGSVRLKIYWKSWVLMIWLGGCLMMLGGLVSLLGRRSKPMGAKAASR